MGVAAACGAAALSLVSLASAQTTYQGGATGTWNSAANWSGGTIAGSADTAVFGGATALTGVTLGANQSALGLSITNTAATTIANTGGFSLTLGSGGIAKAVGSGALTIASAVVLGANQSWTNSATNSSGVTVSGAISGTGITLNLSGVGGNAGFTISNNANSYTGTTNITSGRVTATAVNALGTSAVTVASGAQVYASTGGTYNNSISIAGTNSTTNGGDTLGALRLDTNTVWGGTVTLSADARIGSNNRTSTVSGKITGAHNLELGSGTGNGTLIVSNTTNDWTGNTAILTASNVRLGANEVIPDGAGKGNVTVTGGLDLNGKTETINGLSGAGTISSGLTATTGSLTVGGNGQTSSFTGVITNALVTSNTGKSALTKTGAGTLTLSGKNSFTGGATVGAGTVIASNAGGTGTSFTGNTTLNNATVTVASTTGLAVGQAISGTNIPAGAVITAIGSATQFTISSNATATGTGVSLASTGDFGALGGGAVTINGTGTLQTTTSTLRVGGDLTLTGSGVLSSINGASVGTLNLAAGKNFSFTGGTWVVDLAAMDSIAGGAGGVFTITGGTLALSNVTNYAGTYALLTGFDPGTVGGTFYVTGYDTSHHLAVLSSAGILSFTSVPEPHEYAVAIAGLLGVMVVLRRRRAARGF